MSDFTSSFWSAYISVIAIGGILACGILLWLLASKKTKGSKPETMGHVWDEDLCEYNNPLPRWWMWGFYISIIFALVYLFLFPGLGAYEGYLKWTSKKVYDEEIAKSQAEDKVRFAKYLAQDIPTLAKDEQAKQMAKRMFLSYCSQCHGSDAQGSKGYPNLTDSDWLHGGSPEKIKETITKGRHGVMPSQAQALGSEDAILNVANYVLSLSGSPHDEIKASLGKPKFLQVCAACHGAEGKGNQAIGAPNLSDKIWLYGGTVATISETIRNGRDNQMPVFGEFLGEGKIHVLTSYVWGLSNDPSKVQAVASPSSAAQSTSDIANTSTSDIKPDAKSTDSKTNESVKDKK